MFYPNLQSFVWRRNVVVILALKYGGQKATDTESVFEFSYRREYILWRTQKVKVIFILRDARS